MVQVSLQWQQFIHRVQGFLRDAIGSSSFKQLQHWFEAVKGRLLGLAIGLVLLLWNWVLLLALAIGVVTLVLVYLALQGQLRLTWLNWRSLWSQSNRSLTVAVSMGGIAALSAYWLTSVWAESDHSWMTFSLIGQSLMTLAVLLLLGWMSLNRFWAAQDNTEQHLNQLLTELAHPDPLKRLLAVRQITQCFHQAATTGQLSALPIAPAHLTDCFRLMLNRETEPAVCNALVESLQQLNHVPQMAAGREAWAVPSTTSAARVSVNRQSPLSSS